MKIMEPWAIQSGFSIGSLQTFKSRNEIMMLYHPCSSESPKEQNAPVTTRKDENRKLPSNPEEVEDLRRSSATNPLIVFTFDELKKITENFRQDYMLGGGGFGIVYKGFVTKDLSKGLHPVPVAVKVHDGDNSFQGHREWLVIC